METLKFTKEAIYRLEKEKGVKIGHLQSMSDPSEFSFSMVVDLVWAGRLYKNPNVTTQQVIQDFDFSDMGEYAEAIAKGIDQAFGDIEPPEDPEVGEETADG